MMYIGMQDQFFTFNMFDAQVRILLSIIAHALDVFFRMFLPTPGKNEFFVVIWLWEILSFTNPKYINLNTDE